MLFSYPSPTRTCSPSPSSSCFRRRKPSVDGPGGSAVREFRRGCGVATVQEAQQRRASRGRTASPLNTSTMQNTLDALPEDVLIEVLCYLDAASVLSAASATKFLRSIALSKPVWRSVARYLVHRGVFHRDVLDSLPRMPVEGIVAALKTAVCGPPSWGLRPTDGTVPAPRTFRPSIHALIPPGGTWTHPTLLGTGSDGQHIFFMTWQPVAIFCWSVTRDELVWRYAPGDARAATSMSMGMGVDVREGGKTALVAFCFQVDADGPEGRHLVADILSLDLENRVSKLLLSVRLPRPKPNIEVLISGSVVLFRIAHGELHVLVDVQNRRTCFIAQSVDTRLTLHILPTHILFAESAALSGGSQTQTRLGVIPLSVLSESISGACAWSDTLDLRNPARATPFADIVIKNAHATKQVPVATLLEPLNTGEFEVRQFQAPRLWALASPLVDGAYRVWVCVPVEGGSSARWRMHAYRLAETTLIPRDIGTIGTCSSQHPPDAVWYSGTQLVYVSGRERGDPAKFGVFAPGPPSISDSDSEDCAVFWVPQDAAPLDVAPYMYTNSVLCASGEGLLRFQPIFAQP
ncbi:F-box domain-containing protein [Mycena kentingensis (nom. inval.)]|nr:F-box domain-containing protein [Mycena kentingensis (nom. inval.)]